METVNHECYVSPEVAKLLKQAGFDWKVRYMYRNNNPTLCICTETSYRNIPKPNKCPMYWQYAAPSLEVAQRWLREVMNISVDISSTRYSEWEYVIRKINQLNNKDSTILALTACRFYTYEEAQESGIKKALEIIS